MKRLLVPLVVFAALASCAITPDRYDGDRAPRSAEIVPLRAEQPLIALALGSGGARGFAHVGVIKALEAAGIEADIVTGASSGAVVAALYAAGFPASRLEEIALDLDRSDLVDFVLFGNGWVRGEALQEFVNGMLGHRPIERLPKAFAVVATEAKTGRMTVFNRGDAGVAVRASASVPKLFVPPVIDGEEYIDGGLTSPVPVRLARRMGADVVIAVDVSWFAQARNDGADLEQVRTRPRYRLLEQELAHSDVVISPRTVRSRMLDFDHRRENIAAGEQAAREAIPRLREIIARVAAEKRRLTRAPNRRISPASL
jgi:NTE family protein